MRFSVLIEIYCGFAVLGNLSCSFLVSNRPQCPPLSCLLPVFWKVFFGTQRRRRSIESVMQEWFPFNHLQLFVIIPIVEIELEAIQAIVLVPFIRVFSVGLRSVTI